MNLSKKYETSLSHLRSQLTQTQEQVSYLDSERLKLHASKSDLIEQITLGKKEVAKLVERCHLADSRCESLSRQLVALVNKESELVQTRKQLRNLFIVLH